MTLEEEAFEAADQLIQLLVEFYAADWARRDQALAIVERGPEFTRLVAGLVGTSHRNLFRWAESAKANPRVGRRPEYSPRTHVRDLRRWGGV